MGKYAYLNLTQKMIKIRKMVPKLLRKRYSEEVPYDFVRLDDVYEYLTPALNTAWILRSLVKHPRSWMLLEIQPI